MAALVVIIAAASVLSADGSDAAVDEGFVFSEPDANNNVTITGYTTTESKDAIIIPSKVVIDGVECTVVGITEGVFKNAYTSAYKISGTIDGYKVENGVLYSDDGKTLFAYPMMTSYGTTPFTTPTTVTRIADFAFSSGTTYSNFPLTITLTAKVAEVGSYAFLNCNFSKVVFNASSITFGDYAMCGAHYYDRSSSSSYIAPTYVFVSEAAVITNIGNGLCYYDDGTYKAKTSSSLEFADNIFVKNESLDFSDLAEANGKDPVVNIMPKAAGDTFIADPGLKYQLLSDGTVDLLGFYNGAPGYYKATTVDFGLEYTISKMSLAENNTEYSSFVQSMTIGKDVKSIAISKLAGFTHIQSLTVDKDNGYYSVYSVSIGYREYQYNLTDHDCTTLYHAFAPGNYSKEISKYTVPSTITTISANAFVNVEKIGTFEIGYQVATVNATSYGSMKFYESDGKTEITYKEVRGGIYVSTEDPETSATIYVMKTPDSSKFYISCQSPVPVSDSVDAFLSFAGTDRLLDIATFTSSDESVVQVGKYADKHVTLITGENPGTATITAVIDYNGTQYTKSVSVDVVKSEAVGTHIYVDDIEYVVVKANQVDVFNPGSTTIPVKVVYNEVEYKVVGVSTDGYYDQPSEKYSVAEGHQYLSTDESGALFNYYKSVLYFYPRIAAKVYEVPDTVTTIKSGAFEWCEIEKVTVHQGAKIENCAFAFFKGTIYLEDYYITDNGTTGAAFANDGYTSNYPVRSIFTYDENLKLGDSGYTKVYLYKMPSKSGEEFKYKGMTMYYQGGGAMYVTVLPTNYSEISLTSFTYGCAEYYIRTVSFDEDLIYSTPSKLVIGSGVTGIWSGFKGFTNLSTIIVEEGNDYFSAVGGVFVDVNNGKVLKVTKNAVDVVIPEGVKIITEGAIGTLTGLKSISFPSTLTEIGEGNLVGLTFKDGDGNIIEPTAENLAGNDFVDSEAAPGQGIMVLDDKVEKFTVTIIVDGSDFGSVDVESFKIPVGSVWSASDNLLVFETEKGTKTVTATAGKSPAHHTYEFAGWSPESGTVEKDVTITAVFRDVVDSFKVTVSADSSYGTVNGESSVDCKLPYGATWKLDGNAVFFTYGEEDVWCVEISVTEAPAHRTNMFTGLSPSSGTVEGETRIVASFEQDVERFEVTVASSDGTIGTVGGKSSITVSMPYGTTWNTEDGTISFVYGGKVVDTYQIDVMKAPEHHVYSFVRWDAAAGTVEKDVTITAQFKDEVEKALVTVRSGNAEYGTIDYAESVTADIPYDTTWSVKGNVIEFSNGVKYTAYPSDETVQYSYSVGSWSEESGTVSGDTVITMTFVRELRQYTLTVMSNESNFGGFVVEEVRLNIYSAPVEYGSAVTIKGDTVTVGDKVFTASPYPAIADQEYVFDKWVSTSSTVTGDTDITLYLKSVITKVTPDSGGNVKVDVKGDNVEVTETVISEIKQAKGSFTTVLTTGSVSFDAAAVGKISSAGEISITDVLDKSVKEKVKDASKVVSVDFGNNHDFNGGKITVKVPYSLAAGEKADDICIGYVNGDKVEKVSATYADSYVTFEVDHLSTFAVLHNDFFNDGGSSDGFPIIVVVVIVVVVLAAAGAFAFVKFKGSSSKKLI